MALEILKIDIDRVTGHTTAKVRVIERHPGGTITQGPVEHVGIDHHSLTGKYACATTASPDEIRAALTRWLGDHHRQALSRKRALDQRAGVISGMAGQTLEFPAAEEPA